MPQAETEQVEQAKELSSLQAKEEGMQDLHP